MGRISRSLILPIEARWLGRLSSFFIWGFMYIEKSSHERMKPFMVPRLPGQGYSCSRCSGNIHVKEQGRSVWLPGFIGGSGEVRMVGELFCPNCDGFPRTKYGTPICEDQILEVE